MKCMRCIPYVRFRYDEDDAQPLTRILTSVTNCIQIVQLVNAIPPMVDRELLNGQKKRLPLRFGLYAPLLRSLTTAEFNDRR